ncbi:MAG: ABC transporter ATP-binding protein [Nanoarchaeota archaeon]
MTLKEKQKKPKLDFKYNLKVYWSFLRNYKVIVGTLVVMVLIMESFAAIDRYLFKVLLDKGALFVDKTLSLGDFTNVVLGIVIIFGSIGLFRSFITWNRIKSINILSGKIIQDLKTRFFNHIVTLSHSFHTTHKTGSLIARLGRGAGAIDNVTDFLVFDLFVVVFQAVILIGSFIYFEWQTAIVSTIMIGIYVGYQLIIQKKQRKANQEMNRNEDIEKANVSDIFMNIDSIKYYGKEDLIKQKYANLTDNTKNAMMGYWDYFKLMASGQNILYALSVILVMYFPVSGFLAGEVSIGTISFIYLTYSGLFWRVDNFVNSLRAVNRAFVDFNDLFQYGKIEQEVKDIENASNIKIKEGRIEYENVGFKYNARSILKNFNLNIRPGEKVALVGHSGSGKTTLVKLLYRLYDTQTGSIKIDGKNIKDVKQESLREELSIVPQECILFDDTIYNNIKFSRADATREEVLRAIRFAQLDKIISNFPYKENTIVGERGVKLSGGEKQRVSIARAILADRKVLVLDEATSSLDSQTEHEIQRDLVRLMEGRTSIIIAHRLSTIMHADKIVVLDNGKIVQIGKHEDLIRKPGQYRKLWDLQKGGYIGD